MWNLAGNKFLCLSRPSRKLRPIATVFLLITFFTILKLTLWSKFDVFWSKFDVFSSKVDVSQSVPVPNVIHFVHFINKEDGKHRPETEDLDFIRFGQMFGIQFYSLPKVELKCLKF
jgi:hypothetical protein